MADFLKRAARQATAFLVTRSRVWRMVPPGRALVLRYHRIAAPRLKSAIRNQKSEIPLALPAAEFEEHLRFLRAHASVMTAGELAATLAAGKPLPWNAVAITFDDGYEDNCSQALPLLRLYGLRATFFITTGWIGTEKVLWWDRLHDYIRQAAELGARPVDYEDLPQPIVAALAAADLRTYGCGRGLCPPREVGEDAGHGGPAHKRSPAHNTGAERLESALVKALGALTLGPEETDALAERIAAALGADVADPAPYRPMTWDQVRQLHAAGMEVGSHTVSHARLANVPAERAYAELERSRQAIERELGGGTGFQPVRLLAYPAGSHSRDVLDLVQEAGYEAAFTTTSGPVCHGDDPLRLRRVGVWAGGYRGAFARFSPSVFGLQLGRLARQRGG